MLMVIFGAGASFDSSPDFPPPNAPEEEELNVGGWRPPLANQLFLNPQGAFSDIVQRYDRLRPILSRLRQVPEGRSVEQQLEIFQNEADAQMNADRERRRQLFAVRYYLYELFRELSSEWLKRTDHVTNYVSLIDQIRQHIPSDEPVALVTFNYDSLLDDALLSFSYNSQNDIGRHFDAHPTFKLFRPHGSVNWSRLTDLPGGARRTPLQLIEQADSFNLTDKYVVAVATDPHQFFNYDGPIVPAIAIPVQTKTDDTFEWPESHRHYLEKLLPQVTKILIVGWQAREAHFSYMLRSAFRTRNLTHLKVVGKDAEEAGRIVRYFAGEIGLLPRDSSVAAGGFSQFVAEGEGEPFFRA